MTRLAPSRLAAAAPLVFHIITAAAAVVFVVVAATNLDLWRELLRKDSYDGAGLIENLTVLVLLPAIPLAIFAALRWGNRLPWWPLRLWIILWALAAIYLAGEEISWGQWHFQWETPEAFAARNDQGETNLHNMSSWLDQKPRTLVELFIIVAGLMVPVLARVRSGKAPDDDAPGAWILAHRMCWSAAGAYLLLRVTPYVVPGVLGERLDASELRELAIAWFIAVYLVSFFIRLRARPGSTSTP